MKCPTTDKLSQYVDNLLDEQEMKEVADHTQNCLECMGVVEAFRGEQAFLKETLQTPTLPDDFDSIVLSQLEPYGTKKKQTIRKRIGAAATGIIVAFGLTATFSPSFAEWVGGLFTTEQVDEGLRLASDAGFVSRVDKEATDRGVTVKVEDVVADTTRIALSYQILNEDGMPQDAYFDFANTKNEIYVLDPSGNRLELSSMGWTGANDNDYGLIELSLMGLEGLEELTVKLQLTEIDGLEGNWELDIPVDLSESLKSTKTVVLEDKEISENGVKLNMKEVRYAPSTNEILYETSFTKEEQAKVEKELAVLEKDLGKMVDRPLVYMDTAIQYHIENQEGQPIYYHNAFLEGKGHTSDVGLLQGSGNSLDTMGGVAWSQSFIPQTEGEKLTFVLDGVVKTVPTNYSITIKPKELRSHPVSFEFEGNHMVIKDAEMKSEFSIRKSIIPIEKETFFSIEMEGGKDVPASEFSEWLVVDDKGKSYETSRSSSVLDEKDENGRYKTTLELRVNHMEEVPEELTLHLISVKRFEPIEEKWVVPLY